MSAPRSGSPGRGTALLAMLVFLILLAGGAGGRDAPATKQSTAEALASLPAPAQAAISRVLGRDQRAYRARAANGAVALTNDAQRLSARFQASGFEVRSGATRLGLSLRALGYGKNLAPVAAATPQARANRVSYRRGPLTEWYLNGPLGLEQGFTLQRAPAPQGRSGALTLELALSGSTPSLQSRTALSFAHSTLRYRGLFAADARGKHLPAWLELHERTLLVRVDDAGARYPLTIDPFLQQAKLVASEAADDFFATSVAVSGDTVVAGAPAAMVGGNTGQGSAYVFVKPLGGWANGIQTAKLTASDGAAFGEFGFSVAVSGDTVVAGAPGDSSSRGSAYVFVKSGAVWAQQAKLIASDGVAGDRLGSSVSVSADTVVAGAPEDDGSRGSAYVFIKSGAVWAQQAKLTASDRAPLDRLGSSVSVSADTVAAGAPGDNSSQGSGYVFARSGTVWTQAAKLTAAGGAAGDFFGNSIAVSADTVVAGAPFSDLGQGAAYVFVKPGGGWVNGTQTAKLTASDGAADDLLGTAVAVSGDTVVAGASQVTVGGNTLQGAAYVFVKPVASWTNGTERAKLVAGGAAGDSLGFSLAFSGDTIVAGAPSATVVANSDQGAAYVFVRPGATWASGIQAARLTAADGEPSDGLGPSVALSGDTIVVGAPLADLSQGAAYVFVRPGATWASMTQTAKLTALQGAAGDQFGAAVAVSGDTVVAGAPFVNGDQGAAYVFVKPGGGWINGTETAKLTASDGAGSDQLGTAVAVSGDTVGAGAPGSADQGAAYVFVKPGATWSSGTEMAKLTASDGTAADQLGTSIAMFADTVVAGAPGVGGGQGAAYVFVKPGGGWATGTETAKKTASDGAPSDQLGLSIALSADTIIAGAPGDDGNKGSAYVFVKVGASWTSGTQTEKLTAADGAAVDFFGSSVGVSGGILVAGARSADVGGNPDAGAVYVFHSAPPTAVRLHSFITRRTGAGVVLRWRTASELDTMGFNVYREQAGRRVRLNRALLPGLTGLGATYRFVDRSAPRSGSFRYRLQSVGLDGTRSWLGTARTK